MIPSVKIETLMWSLPIVFMFHDFEKSSCSNPGSMKTAHPLQSSFQSGRQVGWQLARKQMRKRQRPLTRSWDGLVFP